MKYKVIYEYRGDVTVNVDADSELQAERLGRNKAEELIGQNLELWNVNIRKVTKNGDLTLRTGPPIWE